MSEEADLYKREEWALRNRLMNSMAISGFVTLPLFVIGTVTTGYSYFKKSSPVAGLVALGVAGASLIGNIIYRNKLSQDSLDLAACKLGILPREELHKRHIKLSRQEVEDVEASIKVEFDMNQKHVRDTNGFGFAEHEQKVAQREAELKAARQEWQRRVELRKQAPRSSEK